jgi:hypothetical protein
MPKPHISIIFIVIMLLVPIDYDAIFLYFLPVVPGMHTTVFTTYPLILIVAAIILCLIAYAYWKVFGRSKAPWHVFVLHLFATFPLLVFCKVPSVITFFSLPPNIISNDQLLANRVELLNSLFWFTAILFAVAQFLLIGYLFPQIKKIYKTFT